MKPYFAALILCTTQLGACHEPVAPDNAGKNPSNNGGVHIPSAGEIAGNKDHYYAQQLPILQAKDPVADARAAIAKGELYFLCNAGRSATVPGVTAEVFASVKTICPTQCLDGVTDALYGENHSRYLSAALEYSARWNQTMLPACSK